LINANASFRSAASQKEKRDVNSINVQEFQKFKPKEDYEKNPFLVKVLYYSGRNIQNEKGEEQEQLTEED